jgi:hypothetical protein
MSSSVPLPLGPGGSPARHLPPGCTIRRAAPGDAQRVASVLRADDRLEMEALEGRSALDVLQGWMSGGSHVLAIRGDAVAIFGIVPCAIAPGEHRVATPWAVLVSTLGRDDLVDMLWLSRFQVDAWQQRWPVLQTVCDARNAFRGQWLDWLGFERRGRVERFGAAGLPFDLHVRLRDMGQPPVPCRSQ